VFVDKATIQVKAGAGGPGAVSWRREMFEPKGGPNGGDGGKGGDVIVAADEGMSTLYDFRHQALWTAQNGEAGGRKQCTGAAGKDLIIRLPPGTLLFNAQTAELIHDLKPGEQVVIARGGRGGFGNEHFKTSTNQTPKSATPGDPGEEVRVRLELKLIAEVGIVGLPNAGKSTLLAALTAATPKIADYPFTTLSPQLGVATVDATRRVILADIPGLIEGASQGAGLGHDFLRHIERTRVIVHLVDARPQDESNPADNYRLIREELRRYSPELADKPELIVLNKADLFEDANDRAGAANHLARELGLGTKDLLVISGAAREGLRELLERLWAMLHPAEFKAEGWKTTTEVS
jgi:GTPase